jgi:diguanylate cyclase (GGDEF)-like protein/PAS domain S-box-containing protein
VAGACVLGFAFSAAALKVAADQRRRWRYRAADEQAAIQRAQDEAEAMRERLRARDAQLSALTDEKRRLEVQAGEERAAVAARERLLATAVSSANDVVMITDADPGHPPRVVLVNEAFERMTGYAPLDILGRSPKMLQGIGTDAQTLARIRTHLRDGRPVQAELLNYRKDGSEFWVELNIQPIFDGDHQTHWISVQRDVTERKRAAALLEWQANHDSLTNLPNRKLYQERLGAAIDAAQGQPDSIGVLFFDLDRFKQINDTLGHLAGDKLLQEVAVRLQARLRPADTIARVGGDEFTILLPHVADEKEAGAAAQRLLDALHDPFEIDGQELWVTASAGVSIAPRDGEDIATLLKNADVAMYRAKDEGRDSFRHYNETMDARALDQLILESHLRRAVEKDEFVLLYQPQVDLKTGRVYGVEALIRWEHPQLGRVSPAQFIPLAEETGMIVEIGAWALLEACRQGARWEQQGRRVKVAVNLSARQFEQVDLAEQVERALRETDFTPEHLDLELTESTLMRGKEGAETLKRLKGLGVCLSVDDFGTGYSSLSYLKQFPLDVIKIDRSFVMGLAEDRMSEAVVRALIGLAHDVDLEVVAEGVETELQRGVLTGMGCDAIQGYLISPPTTPDEVEAIADGLLTVDPLARRAKAPAKRRADAGALK